MTFRDDVMLPRNLDALPVIQTHSKIDKLQVNDYNSCYNHMLLICKCNYSNLHIVHVIHSLSCLSDRKERNKWVISSSQDGQHAVISDDLTLSQALIKTGNMPSSALKMTMTNQDQSRKSNVPWTELLYTSGTSTVPWPTKSGVAITSSSNDQPIIHKFLNLVKSGYYIRGF